MTARTRRPGPGSWLSAGFSPAHWDAVHWDAARWDAARRRVIRRAFGTVPFYREQWAAAGRRLAEPEPVPSQDLADQLFRLCPLGRPFDPAREPSLWSAGHGTLRTALDLAVDRPVLGDTVLSNPVQAALAVVTGRVPVIDIRAAMTDLRTLGPAGPPYAVYLPPGADVVSEERRHALNRRAVALAAARREAIVIGDPAELSAVIPEILARTPVVNPPARALPPRLRALPRTTPVVAFGRSGPVLVHDPVLGCYAARVPSCGRIHLLWRRFHARIADGSLQLTALRRRRPTLCNVVPAGATGAALGHCCEHGVPALVTLAE